VVTRNGRPSLKRASANETDCDTCPAALRGTGFALVPGERVGLRPSGDGSRALKADDSFGKEETLDTNLVILIVVLVVVFGGGGFYWNRRR